ncbi:MAG: histidinol-phosphate transaminase [Pseudomonadota bacterium]
MNDDFVKRWVRPEIGAMHAYAVADATGMVKLDAMENPYAWPPALREDWSRLLQGTDVNRYPDPRAGELTRVLRDAMQVPPGAEVLLGNGSDEIIQMLAMTLGGPGRTLVSVDPGFVMYRLIAAFTGMAYHGVALDGSDFGLDADALLQAIRETEPALVFLAYPNNPTGNLFDAGLIEQVIESAPGLVVIDEAYAPFTDASFMPRVDEFANLAVMRTLSKMGLAGLRLGLLAGRPSLIREVDKTRLPYNINTLTQRSASFALEHLEIFDAQTGTIRHDRELLYGALAEIDGITPYPSAANFILFRCPAGRGPGIFEGLKQRNVLIKNLDGSHALLRDCLRVTVGTPQENDRFQQALKETLAGT